jgi:glyoxalase family protein
MKLTGIHHLTAVTGDVKQNKKFYTETLGLRLVKKTVNQDDVSAYHLFYADGLASPGTDITFFDWPLPREVRGSNSVVLTGFRIPEASFEFWQSRLDSEGVISGNIELIDGRRTLPFEDGEGQRLAFVADDGRTSPHAWTKSPVPGEHQILGLGPISISVPELKYTAAVLERVLEMQEARMYQSESIDVHVFAMGEGGPAAELHVAVEPGAHRSTLGAGAVHHVAFRVPTFEDYDEWAKRLTQMRIPNSGPVDRYYFRSLYFREPNGILFELATDGPGFTADEPLDTLGEKVSLPPFLEPQRDAIIAGLKPL